jgi:predicted acyltransferase
MTVDEFILGRFRDGTTYTWILSGMTFAATTLLGVQAGHLLRSRLAPISKVLVMTLIGLLCLLAGWFWANPQLGPVSLDWLQFPIVKHIWTSSMVLWAAGWSYLLLAVFYLLIDVAGRSRWAFPFVVIGMNAITIYVVYHLVSVRDIAEPLIGGLARHAYRAGPILIELATVLLVWLLAYHMYRQRIFLRV